ncbi:MAG TPA: hypothetical protein VH184_07215 [Dongiaceae bacterium]|jgi:hypothetical protein|nr:hypothetical protein [Dongiaceae bacterium]
MASRLLSALALVPALLFLACLWLMDKLGLPDTAPGHTWSTQG